MSFGGETTIVLFNREGSSALLEVTAENMFNTCPDKMDGGSHFITTVKLRHFSDHSHWLHTFFAPAALAVPVQTLSVDDI